MRNINYTILFLSIFLIACKKNNITLSSEKEIYSFVLPMPSPLPYFDGVINNDTITVKVPVGVSLVNITPLIQYAGSSITPSLGTPVNFTQPVSYTVTAEDGSTRRHVVIVSYKSTTKEILDFRFKPSANPILSSDVVGQFINDSSIVVRMPASVNVHTLVPSINHNGVSIDPQGSQITDFSDKVYYTVTAEDGSSKKYNVFQSSNNTVYIGSANGFLYALDALTGQEKWSFNGGQQIGSPIYYQDKIYVSVFGGTLYCLNAVTGSTIWSFFRSSTGYTTPCIFNGNVYVGYTTSFAPPGLYALEANSGNLLWSNTINVGPNFGTITSTPTAVAGYVVVSEFNTGVHVFNAANGNQIWSHGSLPTANPLVTGGVVYIGDETSLLKAYNLSTGSIIWQNNTFTDNQSAPVMANNIIYVNGHFKMHAINKTDGTILWSAPSIGGGNNGVGQFSSPAISLSDTALFAGNNDGFTYCLDLNTGARKWLYPSNGQITTKPNPVAANGIVVVNMGNNSLYALSIKSGLLIWKFTASGSINTDPCMTDIGGNVYYTGNSGNNN